MARVLSNLEDVVVVGPTIRVAMELTSISITCMTHRQTEQYGPPCSLCGHFNHSPKHCCKREHDTIWKR